MCPPKYPATHTRVFLGALLVLLGVPPVLLRATEPDAPFDFASAPVVAPVASHRTVPVDFTAVTAEAPTTGTFVPDADAAGFRPSAETTPSAAFSAGSVPSAGSSFDNLAATAPVQARRAPLLTGPQVNTLSDGSTLYVSEFNGTISAATGSGGTVSTYQTFGAGDALLGIGYFGGSLFVVDQQAQTNVINQVVLSTGAVSQVADLGSNTAPTALAIDGSGNLYVSLTTNNVIDKITPNGSVSLYATLPANASPSGLAFDASGDLYSANSGLGTISKITPGGASVSTFVTLSGAAYSGLQLGGLALDRNGNLYVSDQQPNVGGSIYKISPDGTTISTFANVGANAEPLGLAFDSSGVLYTANVSSISQVSATGTVSSFADDGNGPAYLVVVPVPEPATYLGGALLLVAAGWRLRRHLPGRGLATSCPARARR